MKAAETWVFALLLLGGRSDAGKFVQVNETCSSSSKLFCLKENFVKFCIDLENFTVDWKIDFSCLMQSTEDDQCVSTPPTCEATALPTGPPSCSGPTTSPGTSCNTYYQCVPVAWWYSPRLNTCPNGQLFSISQNTCVPAAQSDCVG